MGFSFNWGRKKKDKNDTLDEFSGTEDLKENENSDTGDTDSGDVDVDMD